jgi:hypothetical protein
VKWVLLIILAGCSQLQFLPYLDQALLLKEFGQEKEGQHRYVQAVDANFEKLVAAIGSGEITKYKTKKAVVTAFGPPLFAKMVAVEGRELEQCLYRHAIQAKSPGRVYLYYDRSGLLVKSERL